MPSRLNRIFTMSFLSFVGAAVSRHRKPTRRQPLIISTRTPSLEGANKLSMQGRSFSLYLGSRFAYILLGPGGNNKGLCHMIRLGLLGRRLALSRACRPSIRKCGTCPGGPPFVGRVPSGSPTSPLDSDQGRDESASGRNRRLRGGRGGVSRGHLPRPASRATYLLWRYPSLTWAIF